MIGQAAIRGAASRVARKGRRGLNAAKRIAHDDRVARGRNSKIVPGMILYESFDGTSFACNPEQIFRYLIKHPSYRHFRHVWVTRAGVDRGLLLDGVPAGTDVQFVAHRSSAYFRALGEAEYLFNNSTFPQEFSKKPGQIYVNTWHGVPLKAMGYDVPGGRRDTRNVVRNLLAADYLVSTGEWMTDTMYGKAFRLRGLYDGVTLESGYPRIDAALRPGAAEDARRRLRLRGINVPTDRQIVLYCPTWRGADPYSVIDDSQRVREILDELQTRLGPRYMVLAKLHQLTLRSLGATSNSVLNLIPNDVPIDEVLAVTDHLVTDYSSVFFDYLPLQRPMHFLLEDAQDYEAARGLYESVDKLPGSVSVRVADLATSIEVPEPQALEERRKDWLLRYVPHEDGQSTQRVVEAVFGGGEGMLSYARTFAQPKEKLLVHAGSLIPNGITSAALALIENLDFDRYDVTVLYPFSKNPYRSERADEIDHRARVLPRVGRTAMLATERAWYTSYTKRGGEKALGVRRASIERVFRHEFSRCFGDSKFDAVLAFDGYQVFWAKLLLTAEPGVKAIWAHNDLRQDAERTIDGKRPHWANLHSLFTLYDEFDSIVSVTPELREINADKLGEFARKDKFEVVQNFLRPQHVLDQASVVPAPALPGVSGSRFVTVARLSPEKDQARIIRSFAQTLKTVPNAGLTIVGDGPLRHELESLAASLGVSDSVLFAGLQANPFPYIAAADTFVFASRYEGQGLAILEARILGKWVVTTRFNVVDSVVDEESGSVVDPDDASLAAGMVDQALSPRVPSEFDISEYQRHVGHQLSVVLNGNRYVAPSKSQDEAQNAN